MENTISDNIQGYYVLTSLDDPMIRGKLLLFITADKDIWLLESLQLHGDHIEAMNRWERVRRYHTNHPWEAADTERIGIIYIPDRAQVDNLVDEPEPDDLDYWLV